ncbi:MAG: fatty acid desaturase [Cytophagales bacterium]|jgi:omega-6 fatty acid desaturase (delta-12 desaturase)|nr:fatty acid desaturase [Cytophagales bacterium]
MRTSKELILATKTFAQEDRRRSWAETLVTLALMLTFLVITFMPLPIAVRVCSSVLCGLLYVRMFVVYHDYQHHAILQKSKPASWLMQAFGVYILAPQTIWKRSHDHHHSHNSKLTITGIGSYPTLSKQKFLSLTKRQQRIYLINRHPLTVIFGYFTLFIYWLNVKSFVQSPKKHVDSLVALVFHLAAGAAVWYFFGGLTFFLAWFLPFFLAFAIGSYLFYSQHNFPSAQFRENHDWTYDYAALSSTSFMVMHPVMHWLTGDIGYHHVHHMNSRIPFYRLRETMRNIPELQQVATTSWSPVEIWRCFRLKLWDADKGRMITLKEV